MLGTMLTGDSNHQDQIAQTVWPRDQRDIPTADDVEAHTSDAVQRRTHERLHGAVRSFRTVATVLEAVVSLMLFDAIAMTGFKRTHTFTKKLVTARKPPSNSDDAVARVCWCVDEACVWYYKRVFCLQRSCVITWMLRRRGVHATVTIGARPLPFQSHAWVEVNDVVVNDRPQYKLYFTVLDHL
jgi:hypothetical protein